MGLVLKYKSGRMAGLALVMAALVVLMTGCRTTPSHTNLQRYEFKQPHMGTLFTIVLYAPDGNKAHQACNDAFAKIAALEQMMTDYDPESELMQLCVKPAGKPVRVSDELFDVLQKAQRLAKLSDGAFDETVGPLVRLWRRARRQEKLPPPDMLARAQALVGYRKVKLDPRNQTVTLTMPKMQLDLGGIGKGYAADKAMEVLKSHGITRALIAASGDILVSKPPPGREGWRVGIGALDKTPNELAQNLLLRDQAISTSGDTAQFVEIDGKRYSHIVDPRTGVGLTERLQVSIVARHATDTDGFATAVSILGVKPGLALVESQRGMEALFLRKDDGQTGIFESSGFRKLPRAPVEKLAE